MDRKLLEQYPDLLQEIKALKKRGSIDDADKKQLRDLIQLETDIRLWIYRLPDSRQRRIVMLRASKHLTWEQIVARTGYKIGKCKYIYYSLFK